MRRTILRYTRSITILALSIGSTITAEAQFAVTTNSGSGLAPTYGSLAAAITALNGATISGPVVITCPTGTETAPTGGYSITAQGTSVNTITIQGNGAANSVITAANPAGGSGSLTDGIFKLIGADYVTIQGFTMQENALNATTTSGSNNMTEWGVAFLYAGTAATANGAKNNTIQNNTITLNRSYANSFGLYSSTRHTATSVSTAAEAASAAGAHTDNKVFGNSIGNVNLGICLIGANADAVMDTGFDIGGAASGTGNTFTNWGNTGVAGSFLNVSGTVFCAYLFNQKNINFSYNTLTSASLNSASATRGIFLNYGTAPTSGSFTNSITNNTVTLTTTAAPTFEMIRHAGMSTALSGVTINLNNNTLLNCSSGGEFVGIVNNNSAPGTLNISGNIIRGTTQSGTSAPFTGLQNTGAAVNQINITNNQIGNASGNAVTYSAANSSAVTGITNTGGASTCALTITGNDLRGFVHSVAGSSAHTYLNNTAATLSQNISNNTFTNLNVNTTGNVTFVANAVNVPATGSMNVNNNQIVTAFNKGGAGGTVTFYSSNASSVTGSVINFQNNTISNITLTGLTGFVGINNTDGGSPTKTITGNTISNISGGTGSINPMTVNFFGATSSVSNNTISNISWGAAITALTLGSSSSATLLNVTGNAITNISTTGGAVTGLSCSSPSTTTTISGNPINTLSSTAGGVTGILVTGGATVNVSGHVLHTLTSTAGATSNVISITGGTTVTVSTNKIYNCEANNSNGSISGILSGGGTTVNLQNNLIGDLRTPSSVSPNSLIGMNITGGTNVNVRFNTVYLNGTSTGVNWGSSAIHAATTSTVTLNNNILVNTSTPSGGNLTVAYRRATTTLTTYGAGSNNNLFYAGTPGAQRLIFHDSNTGDQTLAAFKTRVSTRDAASVTENPPFLSTVGSNANFLHIDPAISTLAESGGANVGGITVDFDNQTRQGNGGYAGTGTAPDIGADEFEGTNPSAVPIDMGATAMVAPAVSGCFGAAETVTITVKNYGTLAIDFSLNPTTVTTQVTGAVTATLSATLNSGTLAVGASQNVNMSTTLNMSTAGLYTFNASTSVTGDGNSGNDAMGVATRTVVAPVSLPQSVDFTGFTGANLTTVFPNWSEATGATLPSGSTSAWTNTTLGGTTTAKINLFSAAKQDWVVGPKFSATGASQLKFKIAITDFASTSADPSGMQGTDDRVVVKVSTDCGQSYSDLFTYNASNTATITNSLVQQTISLNAYAGQEVIIAFAAYDGPTDDGPDYDFHVDDILIENAAAIDMSATSLIAPAATGCYGASETVTIRITNLGAATIDFAVNPTTVTTNVTGAVTATLSATVNTGTLAPTATLDVPMSTTLNMTTASTYTFNASTTVAGDGNAGNDAMAAANRTVIASVSLPQSVNFTGYSGSNLTTVFPNWSEATGATLPNGTTSAWTNQNAWSPANTTAKINLFSTGKNDWIVGPKFVASVGSSLSYSIAITDFAAVTADASGMQGTDDFVQVRLSTNCGASWTNVVTWNAANTAAISNVLVPQTFDLTPYAGQECIVAFFASEGSVDNAPDYDFHIDNITVDNGCLGTPSSGTSSPASTTICAGQTAALANNAVNSGAGITYQWKVSGTSGGPYSSASGGAGATTLNYTTGALTTGTYYYVLEVTCTASGQISTSNEVVVTVGAAPPVATASTIIDCTAGGFYLRVVLSDLGGAADVDLVPSLGTGLQFIDAPGTYDLGPFTSGSNVSLDIVNNTDAFCSLDLGSFTATANCITNGDCFTSGAQPIPDDGCSINDRLEVLIPISGLNDDLGANVLLSSVALEVEHTYRGDLQISLVSPTGQSRNLFLQKPSTTASGDNLGNLSLACATAPLVFQDGGTALSSLNSGTNNAAFGTFAPEQTLAGFTGDPNGTWSLRICDAAADDLGSLRHVRLNFLNMDCLGVFGGTTLPGSPCDDGNIETQNDAYDAGCLCVGDYQDCLGVPGGPALPGSTCDDGIASTGNDIYNAVCVCTGELTDCLGVPGGTDLPGSACDDGNAGTINDLWDGSCNCVGTPFGCQDNEVNLELGTDANGAQTSWEIIPAGGGAALCNGSGYTDNSTITETCCLPDGCYRLLVYDSFGDGMTTGGYRLTDENGSRIIDNWGDGVFTSTSTIANNGAFCLPIGTDAMQASSCDRLDLLPSSVVAAVPNPLVSNQFGIGSNTDDGYQFWIYNPDGGYSRVIFKSLANPGAPGVPYGATAPAYLQLSSIVTNPLPTNVKLNIRVRSRVNGLNSEYGPACVMMIDVLTQCPTTQLVDNINSVQHSCGASGKVVGATGNTGKLYCNVISGANKYQWRFENAANSYVRQIATGTSVLPLNKWSTSPLLCGTHTYDVTVRASFDNGATYCPIGAVCTVGITNNFTGQYCTTPSGPFAGGGLHGAEETSSGMQLWPNPVLDGSVNVEVDGIGSDVHDLRIVVMDLYGKMVFDQVVLTEGADELRASIQLGSDVASGVYLVNVTAGDQTFNQRLVVE